MIKKSKGHYADYLKRYIHVIVSPVGLLVLFMLNVSVSTVSPHTPSNYRKKQCVCVCFILFLLYFSYAYLVSASVWEEGCDAMLKIFYDVENAS